MTQVSPSSPVPWRLQDACGSGDEGLVRQTPGTGLYFTCLGLLFLVVVPLLPFPEDGPAQEEPKGGPHSSSESELPTGETKWS